MKKPQIYPFILIFLLISSFVNGQTYPSFGPEIDVTITGLSFDAMEPFISPDGSTLFFNNLNDGINTKLYYASKIDDSTFNYIGELGGTNQINPPHLDAVADLDSLGNFYWTSTRNYPGDLDNLFHGSYSAGNVSSIGRVRGDFNKGIPGWLVMDHGISLNGQYLYFNNARFDSSACVGPCETEIGLAQKVNDSTFNTLPNSASLLQNVNDTNFIYYAPCISSDDLELYYTRYPRGSITVNTLFEICVAVRNTPTDAFSLPAVLFSELIGDLIEAPTLTLDNQIMYYHRKIPASHKILMRYRSVSTAALENHPDGPEMTISPNPMDGELTISIENHAGNSYQIVLFDNLGNVIERFSPPVHGQLRIQKGNLKAGLYYIQVQDESGGMLIKKLLIQ